MASGPEPRGGEGTDSPDGHGTSDSTGDEGEKKGKQELAEQRTDWAQERTLLAKHRTFGSWLRSGLSAVAVGFGAAEFLGDLEPQWLVKTASALLVVTGAAIFLIGFFGYRSTFNKLLQEGVKGVALWLIGGITLAMVLGAGLLLFAVLGE